MTLLLFVYHFSSIAIVVNYIEIILYVAWQIMVKNTREKQRVNCCK